MNPAHPVRQIFRHGKTFAHMHRRAYTGVYSVTATVAGITDIHRRYRPPGAGNSESLGAGQLAGGLGSPGAGASL